MGWSIPYGYVWGPGGTLVKDDSGAGEFGDGGTTQAPDFVAPQQPLSDDGDIYKDPEGVIRNRTPRRSSSPGGGGGGAGGAPLNARPLAENERWSNFDDPGRWSNFSDPNRWAGQGAYGGGGGGGGGASSATGNVSGADALTQLLMGSGQSRAQGSSNTIPGGSRSTLTSGAGIQMPSLGGANMAGASQYSINTANANSGAMTGVAGQLAGINPQPGQMDRTLYDQYAGFLSNPDKMLENPIVAAALQKAQQAAGRQLSAGRMSRSGNAAQAISEATGQTMLGQYYNMAQTLGGGAQQEQSRWGMKTNADLDAARIRAGALGSAGQVYSGAGTLALAAGQGEAANAQNAELDAMRRAQFIAGMTGSASQGLQAGGFGNVQTTQQYVPGGGNIWSVAPPSGYTQQQSTFNLNNTYGGGSVGMQSYNPWRMT